MTPDHAPPSPDVAEAEAQETALRDVLAGNGWKLGGLIGHAPVPGSVCDAPDAGVYMMPGGTLGCRCIVCSRCGHHTGNSNQGHYWAWCKVTKTTREFHHCCPNESGCELEAGDTA